MCASALSNRMNLVRTSVHVAAVSQPGWVNQTALSNPGCKIAGDHSEAHNIPQPCSATYSFNAHCPSVFLFPPSLRINLLCIFSLHFSPLSTRCCAHTSPRFRSFFPQRAGTLDSSFLLRSRANKHNVHVFDRSRTCPNLLRPSFVTYTLQLPNISLRCPPVLPWHPVRWTLLAHPDTQTLALGPSRLGKADQYLPSLLLLWRT
jgi:hypothetical protein